MLGNSYLPKKYIDVNEHCDNNHDDIDSITNIAFQIKERIMNQKSEVILDNASLERVYSTYVLLSTKI